MKLAVKWTETTHRSVEVGFPFAVVIYSPGHATPWALFSIRSDAQEWARKFSHLNAQVVELD